MDERPIFVPATAAALFVLRSRARAAAAAAETNPAPRSAQACVGLPDDG